MFLIARLREGQKGTMQNVVQTYTRVFTSIREDAFVVITRNILRVLRKGLTIKLRGRERQDIHLAWCVERRLITAINGRVRVTPCANLTVTANARVRQDMNVNGTRVLIRAIGVTLLTYGKSSINKMRAILLIIRIRLVGTTLINVDESAVVKRTSDRPCNATRAKSLTGRLRGPCFIKINGNGELTATMVTMFLRRLHRRLGNLTNNT